MYHRPFANETNKNCQTPIQITAARQNGPALRRQSMTVLDKLIDAREAAEILGITPETIYKYTKAGLVPSFKFGDPEVLREWIHVGSQGGVR